MELIKNTQVYFEDISHSYFTSSGVELMGVTSLMKKHGLSPDYSGIKPEVLAKAAERGNKIHQEIEYGCNAMREFDKGNKFDQYGYTKDLVYELLQSEYKAYILFEQSGIKAISNEYLVSDNKIVATSIDIVADCNEPNMVDLVDIKTTSTLHKEPLSWQLSICAYLFEMQNPHLKVRNLYGLHIRNGKQKVHPIERKSDSLVENLIICEEMGVIFNPNQVSEEIVGKDNNLANLVDIEEFIVSLKIQLKEAEENQKRLLSAIEAEMEKNGQKSIETDRFKITRVLPTTRKSFDSKAFGADYPDLVDKYTKESTVKGSVKITLKK